MGQRRSLRNRVRGRPRWVRPSLRSWRLYWYPSRAVSARLLAGDDERLCHHSPGSRRSWPGLAAYAGTGATPSGEWSARTTADGDSELPPPGGVLSSLTDSLDCDLGSSPLTNTMPVLRHDMSSGPTRCRLNKSLVPAPNPLRKWANGRSRPCYDRPSSPGTWRRQRHAPNPRDA